MTILTLYPVYFSCIKIELLLLNHIIRFGGWTEGSFYLPLDRNFKYWVDKSFADDLNMELGIVSSRVALVLRSAEIKPVF